MWLRVYSVVYILLGGISHHVLPQFSGRVLGENNYFTGGTRVRLPPAAKFFHNIFFYAHLGPGYGQC